MVEAEGARDEGHGSRGVESTKGCFLAILDRSRETIIHHTYSLRKTWNRTPSNGHARRETERVSCRRYVDVYSTAVHVHQYMYRLLVRVTHNDVN